MAQVSYGTITITDTNDINRIYVEYCRSTSNQLSGGEVPGITVNWGTSTPAWVNGQYIWERSVVEMSGTLAKTYGTPVCLTGAQGQTGQTGAAGRSLTSTTTEYTRAAANATIDETNMGSYTWTSDVPTYSSSAPAYWVRATNVYSNPSSTEYIIYKDNGITDAIAKSVLANSISQSANENANGAMSQAAANIQSITRLWYAKSNATPPSAPTSHVTTSSATTYNAWNITRPNSNDSYKYYFYCDETCTGGGVYSWSNVVLDTSNLSQYEIGALTAKVKNYWWDSTGAHIASGIGGNEVTEGTVSTYGYNSLVGLTGISFRYNDAKVVDLNSTTPSLDFYKPPTISGSTVTQGELAATLNISGLKLQKGGLEAGTKNTTDYIYVWSNDDSNHSIGINGSGNKTDWRIVAGNKFGVDKAGNLYASNANISGIITVSSGSDLSAGLGNYSTTSQMNTAIGTATNDMATKTYVTNQGYQTATDVNSIVEGKGYALNSDLTTEINQRKANYGTQSATSSDASSQTKAITCSNFELVAGNEITIYFKYANTYYSNAVQLNINNKGAKAIWVANAVTSSTNQLLWGAGAYITFKYDGTQFIVIGEPRTWYGASTTAASTAAKTDTTAVTGCVICKGAKIELAMSNKNTSTSATLNIQSTGAKNIYYGNTTTRPTVDNGHSWIDSTTATFTFDGQHYRMAGQTVINGDNITTGTISANRLNISDIISDGSIVVSSDISDMATKTYVGNQGYQTASDVSTTIGNTSVNSLSDGSDYTKTANLGNTTAVQNAAKSASDYLGDTDSNAGVTLKAKNGTTTASTSTSNYIKINSNGLEVYKEGVSIALYGDTARIGKSNGVAFLINSNSLQAYYMNGNTRTKYFEVSPTGMTYGSNTVATTSQIPTTVASLSDASNYATKNDAQGYANTAEAKASYSVEIQVTAINYANNSATLVAIPYYQGSTTMPTGVTLSYQWYKNGTALANTSTAPTISGVTTNTLQLGEGTDFGSSTTNAIYTCIIS